MNKSTTLQSTLDEIKEHALSHMRRSGYIITQPITVEVDPSLSIAGYSTVKNGKSVIVVSQQAVDDKSVINLLIHELSHLYCMQILHPSHNTKGIGTISSWALHGTLLHEYQEQIVQGIINHVMDVYADDIAFRVIDPQSSLHLSAFFLQWVSPASRKKDPLQRAWE